MKHMRILTMWNWRIIQKNVLLIIAAGCVLQAAAVCIYSMLEYSAAITYNSVLMNSSTWVIFALEFLAVLAASQRPMFMMNGKTKMSYTMQTLPSRPAALLFSNAASTALAVILVFGVQLLLTFILYFPATALTAMTAQRYIPEFPVPKPDMQLSLVRSMYVRLLLPTNIGGIIMHVLYIIAPSLLLPCALFHKGIARIAAFALGIAGAAVCGLSLAYSVVSIWSNTAVTEGVMYQLLMNAFILSVLTAAAVLWTLNTIKRAKWL